MTVSAMGATHLRRSSEQMRPYMETKAQADRQLAAVLLAVLRADNTVGKWFDVVEGTTAIDEALRSL